MNFIGKGKILSYRIIYINFTDDELKIKIN